MLHKALSTLQSWQAILKYQAGVGKLDWFSTRNDTRVHSFSLSKPGSYIAHDALNPRQFSWIWVFNASSGYCSLEHR